MHSSIESHGDNSSPPAALDSSAASAAVNDSSSSTTTQKNGTGTNRSEKSNVYGIGDLRKGIAGQQLHLVEIMQDSSASIAVDSPNTTSSSYASSGSSNNNPAAGNGQIDAQHCLDGGSRASNNTSKPTPTIASLDSIPQGESFVSVSASPSSSSASSHSTSRPRLSQQQHQANNLSNSRRSHCNSSSSRNNNHNNILDESNCGKLEPKMVLCTNQMGGSYSNGKPLPFVMRQRIVLMANRGFKASEISKQLKVSHGCISKIINKYFECTTD
ncbi:MAG: hypothetical protein MHMPM18_001744 [Marteilia pararefringens]